MVLRHRETTSVGFMEHTTNFISYWGYKLDYRREGPILAINSNAYGVSVIFQHLKRK